jgi:hypothetical protein
MPALESVLKMMFIGFSASPCAVLLANAPNSWLRLCVAVLLLAAVPVELVEPVELPLEPLDDELLWE